MTTSALCNFERRASSLSRRDVRGSLSAIMMGLLTTAAFVAALWPNATAPGRVHLFPRVTVLEDGISPSDPANAVALQEQSMSPAELMSRWEPLIAEASRRFSVPEAWIRAVMRIESGGRTMLDGRPIESGAGAIGLMQLMHETYDEVAARYGLGSDLNDPRDNIFAGAAYLHELYAQYGYPSLFAAYNAGPGRLEDHLFHKRALPHETRNYLAVALRLVADTARR